MSRQEKQLAAVVNAKAHNDVEGRWVNTMIVARSCRSNNFDWFELPWLLFFECLYQPASAQAYWSCTGPNL
jgi:hypothetical protein